MGVKNKKAESVWACLGSSPCKHPGKTYSTGVRSSKMAFLMVLLFLHVQPGEMGPVSCTACLTEVGGGVCGSVLSACALLMEEPPDWFVCMVTTAGPLCGAALAGCGGV